jgi:photosystem II stability/assembly factor-like uncharacterized protein
MAITKNIFSLVLLVGISCVVNVGESPLFAQSIKQGSIKILTDKKGVSLRGLSIPSKNTIWASGSKGTIVKSIDGGIHFEWLTVKGYDQNDFRGIHAWNDQEAIIMSIASPAYILKTKDGGINWYKVYENADSLLFLDAIYFKDEQNGVVIGDPIQNQFFKMTSHDKGEHWERIPNSYLKSSFKSGEAFFASSNSNIVYDYKSEYFITGGKNSRLWIDGLAIDIPIIHGLNSTGANSIAISPNKNLIAISGGDFSKPNEMNNNFIRLKRYKYPNSNFKHLSENVYFWKMDKKCNFLNGYKSSVTFLSNELVISCGTSGVDLSKNGGKSWQLISNESFHVVQKQPGTKNAFLAGKEGRIGYFVY